MARRRRIVLAPCLALLSGGLMGVGAPNIAWGAVAPALEPEVVDPPPTSAVDTPDGPAAGADVSAPSAPATGSPSGDGASPAPPSDVLAADPAVVPEPEATVPAPPASDTAVSPPAVDPAMLDAAADADPKPLPPPVARTVDYDLDDPEQAAAKQDEAYARRFRNDGLGARLNVTARLQFANLGSSRSPGVGGRMGGGSIDIGAAWNRVSIAGTLAGWGGRVVLPARTGAEMNAMFGGGPTLGYGRTALLGHGFFDLRVGYHLYYGVVGARRGGPAVVAGSGNGGVVLTQTENVLPHGPRVRIDMGLLSQANRKRFHAFGLSMGYQGLVHTFRGELPVTHMLTLGLSYWMG